MSHTASPQVVVCNTKPMGEREAGGRQQRGGRDVQLRTRRRSVVQCWSAEVSATPPASPKQLPVQSRQHRAKCQQTHSVARRGVRPPHVLLRSTVTSAGHSFNPSASAVAPARPSLLPATKAAVRWTAHTGDTTFSGVVPLIESVSNRWHCGSTAANAAAPGSPILLPAPQWR